MFATHLNSKTATDATAKLKGVDSRSEGKTAVEVNPAWQSLGLRLATVIIEVSGIGG
jgi:hypothetical protein